MSRTGRRLQDRSPELPLQDGALAIASAKYFLPGEDIDGLRQRLARALARNEADPARWEAAFYKALHHAWPGGRIMANAGAETFKPDVSTINCTVSRTIEDSMVGIMQAASEAALTLKAGCGIGYDFTTLRPRGAFVAGAGATTSGPLPFMDVFDAVCHTVSSAGGRRGAQMGCLDIAHPDIEAFISAKREAGRLRAFNLSCLISEDFLAAVRADAEWPLVFPAFRHEIDHVPVLWRPWPARDPAYSVNARGETCCRIYRRLRARALWDLVMHATYTASDPGFILIDEYNRMNPLWFAENIRTTNPCVTADTWVHTMEGPRQVRELLDHSSVLRIDGRHYSTGEAGFFATGCKPVVRLTTREGYELRLTADHQVRKVLSQTRWSMETQWCEAQNLAAGDRVVLNNHRDNPTWAGAGTLAEGYLLGMLVGDGTFKRDEVVLSVWRQAAAVNDGSGHGVDGVMAFALQCAAELPRRADLAGWRPVAQRNEYRLSLASLTALARRFGMQHGHKTITAEVERASSDFHRGFLRGLFDADGSVQGLQAKGVSVRLSQSDVALLQAAQRMLLRLGIASVLYGNRRDSGRRLMPDGHGGQAWYSVQAQHELVIAGDNLKLFEEHIGFADSAKSTRLQTVLGNYRRQLNAERFTAEVVALIDAGEEPVYDVQVPGLNAFDANGLHAHNCGEQGLPPFGACLLGSVDLASLVVAPFTPQAHFDFATYAEVVRVFARMLDNVCEISGLPLAEQRAEILRKRRHGMGYFGLGSALVMLGLRYGAPESIAFTAEVTQQLALENWRAALELAREKGPAPALGENVELTALHLLRCPDLARDGYKAGQLLPARVLHARYSPYMQRIATLDPALVDALAATGARYTHATSIAPTGTMAASVGNNASNGIEPSFAHSYRRNMIVPGEKAKRAIRMESLELLQYRAAVDADVDPEQLPELFHAAATIAPRAHIEVQAAAQYWIDSSISKTINVPTDIGFDDFKGLYLYAAERGLKGCTTFRFNPDVHQGVLVQDSDLAATRYRFTLADGSTVELAGDAEVEYENGRYTAANLYDALKEGFYGRL